MVTEERAWTVDYNPDTDAGTITHPDPWLVVTIPFQHGPIETNGINGVQNEEILRLIERRLQTLHARIPCEENGRAIYHVAEALSWLNKRSRRRIEQGVEGTNQPHESRDAKD